MVGYDVIVVGAGAAGIMAAGVAAENGAKVLLLEKMEKPARKVRITGKGRCNITNTKETPEFMEKVRSGEELVRSTLERFTTKETIKFFESKGLKLTFERGERVFPASGKAWDVADAMVRWAKNCGVEIKCNARVTKIIVKDGCIGGVELNSNKIIAAPKVIVTTGGLSYPATGSTGDGYRFAKNLGHNVIETRPSLVPLEIESWYAKALEKVALRNIKLSLIIDSIPIAEEFGEMEFIDYSAAGAIVLRLSRDAVDAVRAGRKVELSIDLKSALSPAKLIGRIERETAQLNANAKLKDLMAKLLISKLITPIAKSAELDLGMPLSRLDDKTRDKLIQTLKDFRLPVLGHLPFERAIITAGGVDTKEVNHTTMESTLVKGLYFAGEVLDIDALTGGYNLQLAFSSGVAAGRGVTL